ncbi:MAG: FAD-binding protein, partial [Planctomycetes bacterium]|nr:FAD-binding protein [Planctomycetota bacterium]
LFSRTTNPRESYGSGLAMAARAGALLADLEFVQFHPTILYLAGAARFLISEVTRGAGAVLRDRNGIAFMEGAHPLKDLAPRDVVSRAIFRTMVEQGDTHVMLDLTGVEDPASRFPELSRIAGQFGMDLARHPIPVRPAVHYMVGGIQVDVDGRTSLPGLWAVGECASSGFHGANRMGSNSLLEGLVHGRHLGRASAASLGRAERRFLLPAQGRPPSADSAELNLLDMTYSLKSLMWRLVGIERDAAGLAEATSSLETWDGYLARLGPFSPEAIEVVNMVQVGRAIASAATYRQESRGTHFRVDHPTTKERWNCHTLMRKQGNDLQLDTRPVPGSSDVVSFGDLNPSA